jgi:hypothetical protein
MRSRIHHLVLLALISAVNVAAQPRLRQIFQQAAAAFDRGDFTQAAIAYKQAADLKPSPFAFYNAALALHKSSQLPTAAKMYVRALEALKGSPKRSKQQEADVAKNLGLLRLEQAETLHRAIQAIGGDNTASPGDSCTTSLCSAIAQQRSLAVKAMTLLKQAQLGPAAQASRQNRKHVFQEAKLMGDVAKAAHLTGPQRQSEAPAIAAAALKQLIGPGKASQQRDTADPVAVSGLASDCLRYMTTAADSQHPPRHLFPPVACAATIIRVLTPAQLAGKCATIGAQKSTAAATSAAKALCEAIQLQAQRTASQAQAAATDTTRRAEQQQQTVYVAPEAAAMTAEAAARVAPAAAIRLAAEAIIAISDAHAVSWMRDQAPRLRSPLYELCRSLRAQGKHQLAASIASSSNLWPNHEQLPQHPVSLHNSHCRPEDTGSTAGATPSFRPCHLWSESFPGRTSSGAVDWNALRAELQTQHPRLATEASQGVARLKHIAESFKQLASIPRFRCQLAQLAGAASVPGCTEHHSSPGSAADHIHDNQGLANGRWDLLVFARDGKWTANASLLSHEALKAVQAVMDPAAVDAANGTVAASFSDLVPSATSATQLHSALPPLGSVEMATLGPGSVIREHCGSTNARWRMHVTVDDAVAGVPGSSPATLTVSNDTYSWHAGDVMFFDDSFWHGVIAQTNTQRPRVVLMVDIWHPLLLADTPAAATLRRSFAQQIDWKPGTVGNIDLNGAIRTLTGLF